LVPGALKRLSVLILVFNVPNALAFGSPLDPVSHTTLTATNATTAVVNGLWTTNEAVERMLADRNDPANWASVQAEARDALHVHTENEEFVR